METFNDLIAKLNTWLLETLGEWTLEYYGIWLVALALVTLILLIVIIGSAISGASKNKQIKKLKSGAQNGGKSEEQIREEVRQELLAGEQGGNGGSSELTAEQLDELETLRERCNNLSFAVDDLNHKVIEKQNTIDELSAQLEQANEVGGAYVGTEGVGSSDGALAELKEANDALENENASLRDENMDLQSRLAELQSAYDAQTGELDSLRGDNAELKKRADNAEKEAATRPAVTRPVVTTREQAEAPTQKREPVRTAPVRQKPEPEPVDEDATEDEVYDDYGDDNSPVKVTLKYDNKKNNWVILRSDTDRTYRRLATKAEAVMIAKDLARRLHAQLVVHKKDGKFQKV